jgi:hypothetical protein
VRFEVLACHSIRISAGAEAALVLRVDGNMMSGSPISRRMGAAGVHAKD